MTKAAPKSDVNNSAFFITQPVEKLPIKRVCKGEPLRPSRTFISINNFLPLADDLQAPGTGCFWLTVLCTVSETCRVCDAVMDTLKKITPSRFSTLPTLCWKEKGILTSPRITSKRSCLSIWGSYIFQHTIFVAGNPVREHCLLLPRNDPSSVSAHFFQTVQEKKSLIETFQRGCVCIVPGPHLTIYCCWLEQQGGVVIGATVLQPDNPGSVSLDSQSPPCGGALQQDFLSATGMPLWKGGAQAEMYPDKPLQNNTTQARLAKEQNLTQLVRHYLLNPGSLFSTVK